MLPILNVYRPVCCSWRAIIEANSQNQCNVYDTCRAMWCNEKDDLKASSDPLKYFDVLLRFPTPADLPPQKSLKAAGRLLTNGKLFEEDWKLKQRYLSYVCWCNYMQSFYPRA